MGMTIRQYQGWIRTLIALIDEKIRVFPDHDELKEIRSYRQCLKMEIK